MLGVDYAERATLHVAVPAEGAEGFAVLIAGLTGGGSAPERVGTSWVDA